MESIAIDRKADVPVGVQLGWALAAQIRDGRLLPGQQLPTLREMAESTGLNVNTVRAVYRRLEQQGLIESQQGSGTFVATTPMRAAALSSIAATAAHEARETGLDPREVAAALYVASDAATREDSDAARRRSLRDQIATLERTVAELEADHPGVAPAPRRARRGIGPALLTVDELAAVRASLIRRLTVVQVAIDEHRETERRAQEPAATTKVAAKAKPKSRSGSDARDGAGEQVSGAPARTARPRPRARPAPAGG